MKKSLLFSFFLILSIIATAQSNAYYRITAAATVTIPSGGLASAIYVYSSGAVTLAGNYTLSNASTPSPGTKWRVYYDVSSITPAGNSISLFGQTLTANQIAKGGYLDFTVFRNHTGVNAISVSGAPNSFLTAGVIPKEALDTTGQGRVILGGASNVTTSKYFGTNAYIPIGDGTTLASVDVTGDIDIANTGVTAIQAGVILNADINASAAVTRSKLATGTADHVLINDGSGVMSSEAVLDAVRGGLGLDASAETGFVTFNAGTATIGGKIDVLPVSVSFDTLEQSTYQFYVPYSGTILPSNAFVTKDIEAAGGDATITVKINNVAVTGGVITIPAGSLQDTGWGNTPSAGHTFAANSVIYLKTAKTNAGGKALVGLMILRDY